jgi:hypothetical protein
VEFIGVAVVGAKNEALFPGRVPHVRTGVRGPKKTGAALPTLLLFGKKTAAKSKSPCAWSESIGRIRFRPMYAGANMGHPSRTNGRVWEIRHR